MTIDMKRTALKSFYLYVLIVFSVLVIIILGIKNSFSNNNTKNQSSLSSTPQAESNNYQSRKLNFKVVLPTNTFVKEEAGRVVISSKSGKIYIDRNGTNFSNLYDYLSDLDKNNKATIQSQDVLNLNYQSNVRLIKYQSGENQKSIFMFVNGWVYNIYSNDQPLYPVLDQIAQSFRYTPN